MILLISASQVGRIYRHEPQAPGQAPPLKVSTAPALPQWELSLHHIWFGQTTSKSASSTKKKSLRACEFFRLTPVIPTTWEVEIGRIPVQGQPGQRVSKTPSQPIKAVHGGAHLPSLLHRVINRKTVVQASHSKKCNLRPYLKNN
jgi:hypothetical protein